MIPGSANPLLLKKAAAAQIERSLRFNSADSAYLNRTYSSPTTQNTFTWAGWVKLGILSTTRHLFGVSTNHSLGFTTGNALNLTFGGTSALTTTTVFRDPSAWYHIVWTQSGTSHTLYVNNVSVGTATATSSVFNTAVAHQIGAANTANYFNGYLTNIHFIDGQALTPSSFTETDATTGQLIPKTYTGSYGTNGFNLLFADNSNTTASTLGKDTSGLSNNWTPNNFSISDALTSVAAANGAVPILNTTDTYGTVLGSGTRADSFASSLQFCIPGGTSAGLNLTDQNPTGRVSALRNLSGASLVNSTAVSKFYGGSLRVPLNVAGSYSLDVWTSILSGPFTIEAWVYLVSTAMNSGYAWAILDGRTSLNGQVQIGMLWSGVSSKAGLSMFCQPTSGPTAIHWITDNGAAGQFPVGQWVHCAQTKDSSGTVRTFKNGIKVAETAGVTGTLAINYAEFSGWLTSFGFAQEFHVSDMRVYSDAKYTSNFNPPSSTANTALAAGNDSLVDSPTNYGTDTGVGGEVRGNYCTWSPLDLASTTLANGNLQASGANDFGSVNGTIAVSSGKYYWEVTASASNGDIIGLWSTSSRATSYPGATADSYGYNQINGYKYNNGSASAYGATFSSGDVIGVALDMDAGTLVFYKNGVSQGTAFSSLTGSFRPSVRAGYTGNPSTGTHLNAGQRAFAYTAPSGFKALCTQNLPEGTITTSGSFTGNANADGPVVYLNGVPTAMTINSNAVTFATHADKLSNGFKLRTSSTSYNTAGSNTYLITTTGSKFKFACAQSNP